ncbi:GNAT family N-acetyltransferase [Taibaiella koreensis]|uniref:GNAT family N-acetyltransferase n=1 Tax=Taibaiella koreensis TaxID=1268548 RepID=UPI000E59C3A5|nr:GNAT family N-acetyltransferase [Taibaiella koreensis]
MDVSLCTKADFDQIRSAIVAFWGSDRTLYLHHPMLIYEFGSTAFVIRDGDIVAAYLFGFFSQTEDLAYAHLVAVREGYKRQGLGRQLYRHFIGVAKEKGYGVLKAITTTDNPASIRFHTGVIGMQMKGEDMGAGIPVVQDYSGPGMHRVVFTKAL